MSSCTRVNWGTVIAGAALVTGAVLLFPAVREPVMEVAKSIGGMLKDAVSFIGKALLGSGEASKPMSEATRSMLKYVGGAVLLGGGAAYLMTHDHSHECPHMAREALEMQRASWAENEQLRAMQSIQQARMMTAGQLQQAFSRT